jgi:hypothetical protein
MFIRKNSSSEFIQVKLLEHCIYICIIYFYTLDAGFKTCAGRPASLHYETIDAKTYASWKVDYLKYDNCNSDGSTPEVRYPVMRDALNASGRPIFYSMCGMFYELIIFLIIFYQMICMIEWGVDKPALWAANVGNSWRTTGDIRDTWKSMLDNIDIVRLSHTFARCIFSFIYRTTNLPIKQDRVVGMILTVNEYSIFSNIVTSFHVYLVLEVGNGGMTDAEYVSHFSLWAISKAPLLIGCDVSKMSNTTLAILTNPEVIAINQDPLGAQGKKVASQSSQSPNVSSDVGTNYCLSSTSNIEPKRFQWTYNVQDKSIRSALNGKCLTIENCSTAEITNIVLSECRINDPQAQCQGKNQQWIFNTTDQTITSPMNRKW